MPFTKRNSKQEETKLKELVTKSPSAKKASDTFQNDYDFRMMLVNIRKKEKITQKELSDITGLSQQMISRLETGTTDPTLRTLSKYLDGIGYNLKITKIASNR